MLQYGMPTLIEIDSLEDTIKLCKELDLSFVELNMNFLKKKDEYKCPLYYLVMTGDPVIFESNLMKFNQVVSGELFVDTTYSLMQANQLFKESRIEVFLIDKDNQVLVSGNPFIDKKVRCQYDNLLK